MGGLDLVTNSEGAIKSASKESAWLGDFRGQENWDFCLLPPTSTTTQKYFYDTGPEGR